LGRNSEGYLVAIGRGVLGDCSLWGQEVRGDDVVALILVDDAKVAHCGAWLTIQACSDRGNNQFAGRDKGHGGLEEVGGIAVADLTKGVKRITSEGPADTAGDDGRVGSMLGDKLERGSIGAEPQGHDVVIGQQGNSRLNSWLGSLVNLSGRIKRKVRVNHQSKQQKTATRRAYHKRVVDKNGARFNVKNDALDKGLLVRVGHVAGAIGGIGSSEKKGS